MVRVAMCYFNGIGVGIDKEYSHDIAVKAMDLGNEDAKEFLRVYFEEDID